MRTPLTTTGEIMLLLSLMMILMKILIPIKVLNIPMPMLQGQMIIMPLKKEQVQALLLD